MKREQKSLTNKGFSLVELIIVVAIMAVLIGVLAPQYLRYVEKTRLQRDNTAIADVANVLKIACTEEEINAEVAAAATGASFAFSGTPLTMNTSGSTKLDTEVGLTITISDVTLTSNSYVKSAAASTAPVLTVKVGTNGIVEVECSNWIDTPNGTPSATPKKF